MGFLRKAVDFVARPTHSRTMGFVVMLILAVAVSLTVIVAQQQQQLRQRASQNCEANYTSCTETYNSCNQSCNAEDVDKFYASCLSACSKDYDSCKQNADKTSSDCLASSNNPTPTSPVPSPSPSNIKSCVKTGNTCKDAYDSFTDSCFLNGYETVVYSCGSNDRCGSTTNVCPGTSPCALNKDGSPVCTPLPPTTVTSTVAPTATPTPTPNLFTCANQTGPFAGDYQCATIINGAVQCPTGFGDYSPSAPYTGTSCGANQGCCKHGATSQPNLFTCQNQTGNFAGNYTCADIVNGATQCPSGFSNFETPSQYLGTSCGATRGCCKQNPSIPTPIVSPTPPPGSVQLALSIKVDGIGTSENNIPVRRNKRPVTIVIRTPNSEITKTGTVDYSTTTGDFTGTVDLGTSIPTNALSNIEVKMNLLKGFSTFTFAQGLNQLPEKITLRSGLDDDNNFDISYYAVLVSCFNNKPECTNLKGADINDDGKVNGIDFNIFLKSLKAIQNR